MSIWTHVSCCIRFDGIPGVSPVPDLGNTVSFEDESREKWDNCNIPCGDEGSLQYKLIEVDPDGMPRFVAVIWGDLRGYEDVQEVLNYLDRIVAGQIIRSGIAEIEVEGMDLIVVRYSNKEWQAVTTGVFITKP